MMGWPCRSIRTWGSARFTGTCTCGCCWFSTTRTCGSGTRGGRARVNPRDQRTFRIRHAEPLRQLTVDVLQRNAKPAALHPSIIAQVRDDPLCDLRCHGEPDTDVAAGGREDRGVHADHLSPHVEQRTTEIARVDRRVGLDEVIIGAGANLPAAGRDDAGGCRAAGAKGISHGKHRLTDAAIGARSPGNRRQRTARLYLQQGDVRLRIGADDTRRNFLAIGQFDGGATGIADDVVVCHDEAARIDDEAGTLALSPRRLLWTRPLVAEPTKEFLHRRTAQLGRNLRRLRLALTHDGNPHHRWRNLRDQVREIVCRSLGRRG